MPQISPLLWGFSSFFMVLVMMVMVVLIEWGLGEEEVGTVDGGASLEIKW